MKALVFTATLFLLFPFNAVKSQITNYLDFDGVDDYVQIEDNQAIDFSGDFTIELQFKRQEINVREDFFSKKELNSTAPSVNDVAFYYSSDNKINFFVRKSSNSLMTLTSQSLTDTSNWFHIAVTRSGSNIILYVNGNMEDSGVFGDDLNSNGPLRIGSNRMESLSPTSAPTRPINGSMDEVRIWDFARTSTEINSDMNSELIGNESGLSAYYDFNQGINCSSNVSINNLVDNTSNNDGVLMNFDLTGTMNNPCESNWNGTLTSINEEDQVLLIEPYPNPTSGIFTLDFNQDIEIENIKVFSAIGKLMHISPTKLSTRHYQIDVSKLPAGFYFVGITTSNGSHFTKSLIKE